MSLWLLYNRGNSIAKDTTLCSCDKPLSLLCLVIATGGGWSWESENDTNEDESAVHASSSTRWHQNLSLDVPSQEKMGHLNEKRKI